MSNNANYSSSFFIDTLDRFTQTALLYDFYGSLLTEKQRRIIEMYFMNDLSLSEIGDELGISRQAVGILINRTERILKNYENRLRMAQRHIESVKAAEKVISGLKEIVVHEGINDDIKTKIENIIKNIPEEFSRGF